MTTEELFKKNFPQYVTKGGVCLSPFWDIFCAGLDAGEEKAKKEIEEELLKCYQGYSKGAGGGK